MKSVWKTWNNTVLNKTTEGNYFIIVGFYWILTFLAREFRGISFLLSNIVFNLRNIVFNCKMKWGKIMLTDWSILISISVFGIILFYIYSMTKKPSKSIYSENGQRVMIRSFQHKDKRNRKWIFGNGCCLRMLELNLFTSEWQGPIQFVDEKILIDTYRGAVNGTLIIKKEFDKLSLNVIKDNKAWTIQRQDFSCLFSLGWRASFFKSTTWIFLKPLSSNQGYIKIKEGVV